MESQNEPIEVSGANPPAETDGTAAEKKERNLIFFFDGTGDWAGTGRTNVLKMFQAAEDSDKQLCFYFGGVGTLGNGNAISGWKRLYLKMLDLAVATGLRDVVLLGYTKISEIYEDGDRICLVGFSRGAFTARLVAALIKNFGLLEKRNVHLAPYLWQAISNPDPFDKFMKEAHRIDDNFSLSKPPPVAMMGLFDTVSSVGIFERFQVFPFADKNDIVKEIRHAVSIDESRNAFPEQLAVPDGNNVFEVWFPGVHRDVGGGAPDNRGFESITLDWMVTECEKLGLMFDRAKLEFEGERVLHLGGFDPYVFVGLYPQFMFDHDLQRRGRINYSVGRAWRSIRIGLPAVLGLLFGKAWPEVKPAPKDSGFRYRWPNFKHFRKIPSEGLRLKDYDVAQGPDKRFTYECEAKPQETFHDKPAGAITPLPPRYPFSIPDIVGTFLGVAMAFLIANRMLGEPLGDSWPNPAAQGTFWLFVLYLIHQGFSQKLSFTPLRFLNVLVPFLGMASAAYLIKVTLDRNDSGWPVLTYALGAGLVATLFAQLPYVRPYMRADRAVAYFMLPWFAAGVFYAFAPPIWNWVTPPMAGAMKWMFSWKLPELVQPLMPYAPYAVALAGIGLNLASPSRFQKMASVRLDSLSGRRKSDITKRKKKDNKELQNVRASMVVGIALWVVIIAAYGYRDSLISLFSDSPIAQTALPWGQPLNSRLSYASDIPPDPLFAPIALVWAVLATISGLAQIVQDRFKMLKPNRVDGQMSIEASGDEDPSVDVRVRITSSSEQFDDEGPTKLEH